MHSFFNRWKGEIFYLNNTKKSVEVNEEIQKKKPYYVSIDKDWYMYMKYQSTNRVHI